MSRVAAFPDPHSLARDELTSLLQELTGREEMISDQRRVLHAQIDAVRQELVDRLRDEGNVSSLALTFSVPDRPASGASRATQALRTVRAASHYPNTRHPALR
jgi:hypothetical protein